MNNYKQALEILQTAPALQFPSDTNFRGWLDEEYAYLSSKKATPPEEEWKMEYYKRLVELKQSEYVVLHSLSSTKSVQ